MHLNFWDTHKIRQTNNNNFMTFTLRVFVMKQKTKPMNFR